MTKKIKLIIEHFYVLIPLGLPAATTSLTFLLKNLKLCPFTKPQTQTRIKFISKPESLVKQGEDLLTSKDCIEVLGGLVLVTGLASDSLLEADNQIKEKTPYSLTFTQKKNATEVPREIPTLIKADKVIKAISFLRDSLDISHLDSKTINSNYMQSVFEVWQEHFQKFLPMPPKSQFSHQTWRLVYATIATHWYCPPTVSPIDYKAYICGQGELILDKADNIKEKIATQLNYFEYQIEARKNKIDETIGLKLDEPNVQVLEKFQHLEKRENLAEVNESSLTAHCPGSLTNGKTEESLKLIQQEAGINILSGEASENHSESVLETVAETFSTVVETEETLEETEPKKQTDSKSVEGSKEKSDLTPPQVTKTSSNAPKAEENLEVTEPETQVNLESAESSEEENNLVTEQVTQIQPLNGQVVENVSETDPEKRLLLKLASDQREVLLEGLTEATGCTPSTWLLGNIYLVSNSKGESQLVLKQRKSQQIISTIVQGDIIIKAISRLRKFSETRELLKLPQP